MSWYLKYLFSYQIKRNGESIKQFKCMLILILISLHLEGCLSCLGQPRSPDVHAQRIWSSHVMNKVKIFSWLYFKDRLSTRTNLFAKHIVDNDRCERCVGHIEDRYHVFFGCQTSSGAWSQLHLASSPMFQTCQMLMTGMLRFWQP